MAEITEKDFQELISRRAQTLLELVSHVSQRSSDDDILIRPLLGELLSQAMQIEELLDAYGARNNCRWCAFRALAATIKLFSDVSYELLHIRHVLPAYRLLAIEQDFGAATKRALAFTAAVLSQAAKEMLIVADEAGLQMPSTTSREHSYLEELPAGRLSHDCGRRRTATVSEVVTMLATAFLNLAAESRDIRHAGQAKAEEYSVCLSHSVREESLRSLELRFHNLQSLYDTYVSGTEAEQLDADLAVLRSHISVVFHLLKTATLFAHYYERHLSKDPCGSQGWRRLPVRAEDLLDVLMKYSVTHINLYIGSAEHLCQEMLKRYAEVGRVTLPVPRYRGFHVRPCTLISKLVLHYGSDVNMYLDERRYNAGKPLEMFRANEQINAEKRRWLVGEIGRQRLVHEAVGDKDFRAVVHSVLLALAQHGRLVIYERPLQLPEEPARKEGTLLEKITDEMARLLALGKIDVDSDLTVTFVGDKRVLADIKLLAENGYGEDNFGNNIPLPEKLVYLRR
ncbi:MAG: hypothetical protein ACYTBJ_11290 [Planctomycetota bacterium]|jgi:hypothetical protein